MLDRNRSVLDLWGDSRLLMLPAVGLFAWVSWHCIERPLIGFARARWRYADARPPAVEPAAATALLP